MVHISSEKLHQTQQDTEHVRNICIIAHVDHGKTTLSDFLISSNGIISSNLAGKMRYMDSTAYEQEKRITMKSSAISLLYKDKNDENSDEYIINLIDSPGHVDFSSEVSTAARLSDGCLVLVDVVEGVCTQTKTVLEQAFRENIKPCLVLNKIDRLILEKQMTPMEAYKQMLHILQQVNVLLTTFVTVQLFKKINEQDEKKEDTKEEETKDQSKQQYDNVFDDNEVDSNDFFSPSKGNVLFASAYDGWGFRINDFSEIFSKKMGMNKNTLQQTLWGDFYLNPKKKAISKKPIKDDQPNMFVQFILQNIYSAYDCLLINRDEEKIKKMIQALDLNLSKAFLSKNDHKSQLKTLMNQWLPMSDSILSMVVSRLPNPKEAQKERVLDLIPELKTIKDKTNETKKSNQVNAEIRTQRRKLKKNLMQCDKSDNAEVLIFVSKMFEADEIPTQGGSATKIDQIQLQRERLRKLREERLKQKELGETSTTETDSAQPTEGSESTETNEENNQENDTEASKLVAFCRIFSGTIRVGQTLHILGPRYNASNPNEDRIEFKVDKLFLLMGRGLECVDSVPAGNIFGLGGVGKHILKTATISSSTHSPIFSAMYVQSIPIVRFAIEPQNLMDMPKLVKGLKLLNQADPSVEVLVQETGEHVIVTAGEVHAERCIRDLNERFAKVPITVSPPLVSFRETIIEQQKEPVIASKKTGNKRWTIKIKAIPLPENIAHYIDKHKEDFRAYFSNDSRRTSKSVFVTSEVIDGLKQQFIDAGKQWETEWDNVWCLGPRRIGPNVLLNHIPDYKTPNFEPLHKQVADMLAENEDEETTATEEPVETSERIESLKQFDHSFISGFQLATNSGPLCDEPMYGVCFCIEDVVFETEGIHDEDFGGPFTGQIMSSMKTACRKSFDNSQRRLVEAMYDCEIQATNESVGSVCDVLRRRRAKIYSDDMEEGSGLFIIKCHLPVAESFGFSEELRTRTSGAAQPQIAFSHWQILDVDPFFVPTTEDELEEWGEKGLINIPNIAKQYIDAVRKRKGLMLDKKTVESAEKQRNLSKKK